MAVEHASTDGSGKANYGVDAPGVIRGLLGAGAAAGVTAGVLFRLAAGPLTIIPAVALTLVSVGGLFFGGLMVLYVIVGKVRTREALLARVAWRGDETVLDVGAGAGLLAIGAAKRAPRGSVIGIDVWSAKDLSDNGPEAFVRNAALEGVSDRVDIRTADARALPFPDASFDVALSLLCLHNIEGAQDQALACRQIARVLKPGGVVVIGDYLPTHAYGEALAQAGLIATPSRAAFGIALSLMWIVSATKPLAPETTV